MKESSVPEQLDPKTLFAQRASDLQALLATAELDALVLKLPENILFATGHWVRMGGLCIVFVPARGSATLVVCDFEADDARETLDGDVRLLELGYDKPPVGPATSALLSELAEQSGCLGGRIGYEGGFEYLSHAVFGEATAVAGPTALFLQEALRSERLIDATAMITQARSRKNVWELGKLRRVNEIADIGLDLFKSLTTPGRTEVEIATRVEQIIRAEGIGFDDTRDVRAYAMVCSGTSTSLAWQPFRTTAREITRDELVMIEMGVVADGYWCDRTRTVAAGLATREQRRAYQAVRAAQTAAIAAAVPRTVAREVDAISRATCAEHGFTQYPHHTGHGVGFGYHEMTPTLSPNGAAVLEPDIVLAIEPGIYSKELGGGIRWEDTILVTAGGGQVLGGAEFDLE